MRAENRETMGDKEFEHCPFCGSADIQVQVDHLQGHECRIYAVCDLCGARTKALIVDGLPNSFDIERLAKRWNRRV